MKCHVNTKMNKITFFSYSALYRICERFKKMFALKITYFFLLLIVLTVEFIQSGVIFFLYFNKIFISFFSELLHPFLYFKHLNSFEIKKLNCSYNPLYVSEADCFLRSYNRSSRTASAFLKFIKRVDKMNVSNKWKIVIY